MFSWKSRKVAKELRFIFIVPAVDLLRYKSNLFAVDLKLINSPHLCSGLLRMPDESSVSSQRPKEHFDLSSSLFSSPSFSSQERLPKI